MSIVSLVLSVLIAGLGIVSVLSPDSFSEILRQAQTPAGMYFAAGARVVFGASLLLSAAKSRTPDIRRCLCWVFLVTGLLISVFGFEFFRSVVDLFLALGDGAGRIWGVVAFALGLAITYSVAPRSRAS